MPILWREAMSVDGGPIDRDHQVLIAIINEFGDVASGPAAGGKLQRILLDLDTYAKRHFAREEELQRSIRYPNRDSQHREHLRLIEELSGLRAELAVVQGEELGAVHGRMSAFLNHWLIDHVIKSDLQMKPFGDKFRASNMSVLQDRSDLRGLSILIVDDEPFMRSTLMGILRAIDRSFAVTVAGNGEAALRLIAETKPELVLCDISMEPINGLEVVECLRNHTSHALRATPVIMLTAHDDRETLQRATRLDIKGYLVKPISPKQLGDRLHAIFRDRTPPP